MSHDNDYEEEYRQALMEGADVVGIHVSAHVVQQMSVHYALLRRWASRINLTSIVDPRPAAEIHGLDCLLFAEFFQPESSESVSDIGSGAGFPGIILALARPCLEMTLVEPLRKRVSFLKTCLAATQRGDVRVKQEKLVSTTEAPWKVDTIVSRATLAPERLVQLAGPYLNPGGRLVTTSGENAHTLSDFENLAQASGFESVHRREWKLPGGETRILDECCFAG